MNKQLIQPINEITDSVEMLHEKPNKGMNIFVWLLILIFGTAIVWCCIGDIDYYIKASGILRPNENISSISSLMSGKLSELYITEGEKVNKGDLLFKIETAELEQNLSAYENEKARLETDIENLKILQQCIESGENLFDKSIENQSSYYYKYEKYISDLKNIEEQYSNKDIDMNKTVNDAKLTSSNIREQITKYENELIQLNTLKLSVESNQDLFDDKSGIYAQQYQYYISNTDSYNYSIMTKTEKAAKAESSYKSGEISKSEYDSICTDLTATELEFEKYTQEFLFSVEKNIDSITKSIDELNISLKSANQDYSAFSKVNYDAKLAADILKLDMLSSITDQIKSGQSNIQAIDKEISSILLNIKNAGITAPIDGIVNMYTDLNESDLIQSGQTVATIVPDTGGAFKLLMYIAEKDIQDVETGRKVKLRFSALPYQEYGEFNGTVQNIGVDARKSESGVSYYIAEVSIDDTMEYELVSGMECEARVVTKQRKIIYWLLEKLNFTD